MSLTRAQVEGIAHLARLEITEAQMPVYVDSLSRIIDLVEQRWWWFGGEKGITPERREIPPHMLDAAKAGRERLIEGIGGPFDDVKRIRHPDRARTLLGDDGVDEVGSVGADVGDL